MAGRGKPPKPRPECWNPEGVLQWMEDNPSAPITNLIKRVEVESGFDLAKHTLNQDLARWRKKHPGFAARYFELSKQRRHHNLPVRVHEEREAFKNDEKWMEDWLQFYAQTRNKVKATELCQRENPDCPAYSTISNKAREGTDFYNPKFGKRIKEVEAYFVDSLEGDFFLSIDMAREQENPIALGNLAARGLESLSKEKWSRQIIQEQRGTVEHHHTHEVLIREKAIAASDAVTRLFEEKPVKSLGSGESVTLEADFRRLSDLEVEPEKSRNVG